MQRLSMLAAAGNRQNNVKKAAEAKPREEKADGGALADVGEEDEAAESAEAEKRPDTEAGKSSVEEGPSNNGPVAEEADQVEGLTPPCAHPPTNARSFVDATLHSPKKLEYTTPLHRSGRLEHEHPFPRIDLVHAKSYFCAGPVAARNFCID